MKKNLLIITIIAMSLTLAACTPSRTASGWKPARTVLGVVFERRPTPRAIHYRAINQRARAVCVRVMAINRVNIVYIDHPRGWVRLEPGQMRYFGRVRAYDPRYRARWTMRFRVRRNGNSC